MSQTEQDFADTAIAVVGMAGRFPGADDVDALWQLSVEGRSGVAQVDDRRPGIVPARGVVRDTDRFDAGFFGIPPHEARAMDPQQRMLLEVAQHAFDDAGVDTTRAGAVAVYAACAPGPVVPADTGASLAERYELDLATAAEFAATRLSYRLGLRGESITVQTGCSSSLVAVHLACQSLLGGLSDMALAGGVSFAADQNSGYPTEEGMISSPTGGCRPFDATADGTVPGGGAGLVVLKRLADAERDGDRIRAVILGSAANNDGQTKVGFMAPSPTGQSEAIATAHGMADVEADSIGYVETHGTATRLGDAVEIEGLREAFALGSDGAGTSYCALGSLKANCGHLDRAAGVAGLIRAVLALEHRTIPPMAGFESPNPLLELDRSPFFVPKEALAWERGLTARRAGVSAFGVGGTNVHVVLEEAPERVRPQIAPGPVLLPLSGHTPQAVERFTGELARQLEKEPGQCVDAVAHTLITGRTARRHRTFAVVGTGASAPAALDAVPATVAADDEVSVVFAFPGQGEPVVDGLPGLYADEPVFRATLDHCAEVVARRAGFDLRTDLYESDPAERARLFTDMARFQPAMFAVEWAVAELWRSWGLTADAVLGHSLGEVVAATYAGVFTPDDGLAMVVERSRRMDLTRPGATLSVALSAAELVPRLRDGVAVASVNGGELTTVTGPAPAVAELAAELAAEGVTFRRLHIPRSPHGPAMRPAADALTAFVRGLPLSAPTLPMLSNVTGGWLGERFATPEYWGTQLCSTVRFDEQIGHVGALHRPLVVEVGPNTGLARMIDHEAGDALGGTVALERTGDARLAMLRAAGEAWSRGAAVRLADLTALPAAKVGLPATPFDHSRRWPATTPGPVHPEAAVPRHQDPGAWLYEPRMETVPSTGIRIRGRLHWIGGGAELRDACVSVLRAAATATVTEGLPGGDESPATDVVWCYDGPAEDLLRETATVARDVAAHSPGARVWLLVPRGAAADEAVSVWDAAVAAARVAPQEFPGTTWSAVSLGDRSATELAERLLAAVSLPEQKPVLEIGDDLRALAFERAWPHWESRPLRPGGCYVITGGVGLVGRALAVAHAREVTATIVLLGRRAEHEVTEALEPLRQELAELGSRLAYRMVDVTRRDELTRCFDGLRARFGRIDGVVHAAGFTDRADFVELERADAAALRRIAAAKVEGLAALEAALSDDDADFVILCSSLSTVLGGLRFAPYAAANVALDEGARLRHARGDRRWISVAWDGWSETGAGTEGPARYALGPDDGHEVFRRVLAVRGPLVYVSTGELNRRIAEVGDQLGIRDSGTEPSRPTTTDPAEAVTAVLAEVLGTVPSDPHRDLRADGLESLTLLQIVTRLGRLLGVRISLGAALRSLTVAGLCALATDAVGADLGEQGIATPEPFTVTPVPARDDYPVSSTQRRWLTLLDQGYGGLDLAIDVEGEVTAPELAAAVRAVVDRHSGLRSTFHLIGDGWRQRVRPATDIPVVDLSELPEDVCEAEFARLRETTAARPFDVAAAPPFEVTVVALREGRTVLLLHAHHVLFDGWSSSLFLRDVTEAVRGELGPVPLQYVDFAVAQEAARSGREFQLRRDYWQRHFLDAPAPTRVAPDRPAVDPDDRGELIEFSLDPGLAAALRSRAEAEHTTPFTLMMTAYALLLHELTGDTDLVVGTTAAGRSPVQTEEIIGVFVNPLPLRLTVDPTASLRQLIGSVHTALVGFHEHGSYPLEDLVAAVEPFVGKGLNDTFHCYLLYQNYWRPGNEDLAYRALEVPAHTHHKLMREFEIVLAEGPQGLGGELWYLPSRFSAATARAWHERYVLLLERLGRGDESLDAPLAAGAAPGTGGAR
ncbi:SDR family NAD(P)-dependent oxidoreductase [Streptomyces sp. NPDC094447]|uniref:SDR family NAD(P)-dependent oxidoreductase n=1 Tax=Streptomyces sp. NPDC094447 TaxID=3366062 RepID=UPI003816E7AC